MKDKIKECLKHLQDLPDIKAKLAESEGNAELFTEMLCETVTEQTKDYSSELIQELAKGNPVDLQVEDLEEFKTLQDQATAFYGEWNEAAARLAIASYLETGKKLNLYEDGNAVLTFGELFGLEAEDPIYSIEAKLTKKQRDELPASAFCGPNRSFPVADRAHAIAALRLIDTYKGPGDKDAIKACVVKKAAKFGVGPKATKGESTGLVDFYPAVVEGKDEHLPLFVYLGKDTAIPEGYNFSDEQKEELTNYMAQVETLAELANSNEFASAALFEEKEAAIAPLFLKEEFLFDYFKANEFSEKEDRVYLQQLVAITRKNKITKKELTEAASLYDWCGNKVLADLLERLPLDKVEEESTEEVTPEEQTQQQTTVIPNPVQEAVPTPPANQSKNIDDGSWVEMLCVRPERDKHKGPIKGKKASS